VSNNKNQPSDYKLLRQFRSIFDGVKYRHRQSNLGDKVASYLYEDLVDLGRSKKLIDRVSTQDRVLNTANRAVGKAARRGDGTFGERVPTIVAVAVPDYSVAFGEVATIEIGTEVKILAKAMIKQIDRVCTDMLNQVKEFRKHGGNPISVGIVGINRADSYTGYEGRKRWPTDGKRYKHPFQEAADAESRLIARVGSSFDEFLILKFKATNTPPYPFKWVDEKETQNLYAASLVRISREYDARF